MDKDVLLAIIAILATLVSGMVVLMKMGVTIFRDHLKRLGATFDKLSDNLAANTQAINNIRIAVVTTNHNVQELRDDSGVCHLPDPSLCPVPNYAEQDYTDQDQKPRSNPHPVAGEYGIKRPSAKTR